MKDFWAEELQNQRKGKLLKVAILIVILLIIIAFAVLIVVYFQNTDFRKWCDENIIKKEIQQENTKYIDIDGDDNTKVYAYDKYICVYRKKVLEFYNRAGEKSGSIELSTNNPMFTTAGRYLAICNEIEGNIKQINVSKNGYVSVVISNTSYKSIVDVFDGSGKEIFKTNLMSRVVDISISQDNKYLAIAEVDLSGIIIKSRIQIISIELAKTDSEKAIQYKYEATNNKLIMNIEYQEQNNLICMYNDSVDILQEQNNKENESFKNKKISFMTVQLNNRITLLEEKSTGEYTADTKVRIIDPVTLKEKEYTINGVAKAITTSENRIAINLGSELHIISKNGILLQKYISKTEINDVVMTDGVVGVVYRDKIQIIDL